MMPAASMSSLVSPFADALEEAVEEQLAHVVLGLHRRAADRRAVAWHEACLRVREIEQLLQRIDAAAEPTAAPPVELDVAFGR